MNAGERSLMTMVRDLAVAMSSSWLLLWLLALSDAKAMVDDGEYGDFGSDDGGRGVGHGGGGDDDDGGFAPVEELGVPQPSSLFTQSFALR